MDPLSVPTDRRIRVRKLPVIVEAQRCTKRTEIETLEGTLTAEAGDIIITGTQGETYPVKPAIFGMIYERG